VGGAGLFINSVELRFPVRKPDLGGVLFHDAGNVYSRIGNLSFRVNQRISAQDTANQKITDFDYMVHAVGMGLRYNTPIGPLRVDFAWCINPPQYYGLRGTLNDLIRGGPTIRELRRLEHFQFFFSLGQTY
jgi:outer membrane protein insertion porin family